MNWSSDDGTRRCERRGCSNQFTLKKHTPKAGPTTRRFCCASCRHMEGQYRLGHHARRKFGVCRNDHEITPENNREVVRGGRVVRECLICKRAMERKESRLAYKREWEERNRAHRIAQKRARRTAA